jgi:phage-related holin
VGRLFDHTLFQQIAFAEVTIIGYLAAQEVISYMEHGAALGYKMPQQLLNRLKDYTKDDDKVPAKNKFDKYV